MEYFSRILSVLTYQGNWVQKMKLKNWMVGALVGQLVQRSFGLQTTGRRLL